ncbi:dual specificity phosphatase 28 [Takifugu rubripes]|uniref:Dual specificity phosphatase 28 n=1 Tax=Takifugu flavidus TaxID=433684 RepID=A0A5C6P1U4_9TELE|nr:dual specificity phosphatase 28 [Takifugu rubripes]XP_056913332.1 dual specificity phosphatase 28 [Takifugu flavidus]TWW73108.1 Dual specificity phosphatase 28 [Takifugu flavidus]|eukprot:XP_003976495.2 PREDICTED: dual specificity phosphatase 28 [Takifugu rubripes]
MLQLCKVTGSLLIGNARSACSDQLVEQEGVTLCINVSRQQPFPANHAVQRLQIPVYDDPNEDLYSHFDGCADAIQEEAERGGHALVYCKNGRSRSATICIAYLLKHHRLTLTQALQTVKAARHVIDPNPGFLAQLKRYEQELNQC